MRIAVSGDHDLLTLGSYGNIPIVRPVDFLRKVGTIKRDAHKLGNA